MKKYSEHSAQQVENILQATHAAQKVWRNKSLSERCQLIARAGELLKTKKDVLAKICTQEMGKPIKESLAEVLKCAAACDYYAQNAKEFLAPEKIETEAMESYVTYQPLGVVLAVMPWNFPFWQTIRFAAPGLCAGNAVLLKHASNVPGCAMALEEIFLEAGLPQNTFRTLIIPGKEVKAIIQHPKVQAVTITGSTAAGKSVAIAAAEVLKKCVLELGGSDGYIILEDANLDHAAKTLVQGRFLNAGQSCISPKRIIALNEIYAVFEQKVLSEIQRISFGDPLDESKQMGSMARMDLRDELHQQVLKSIALGAKCLAGGVIPAKDGAFYPPTFLSQVTPGMPAFDEEMFGPVFCLIAAKDEAEALELANQSNYGLGGGVYSTDRKRAKRVAESIVSGGPFINDFLKSDPRLPFGGIKESGYGRELSIYGIREFVNVKTIVVK